jgi:hypothetical protein
MIYKNDELCTNYTKIPNELLTSNSKLCADARIVVCYLLSKPKDWKPSFADIKQNCLNVCNDTMQSIFKELVTNGYATLKRASYGRGKIETWYDIFQNPKNNPNFHPNEIHTDEKLEEFSTIEKCEIDEINHQVVLSSDDNIVQRKNQLYNKKDNNKERIINNKELTVKEKKCFCLNEVREIKQALNINQEQEQQFVEYITYLKKSGMDVNKKNALVYYQSGFEKQKIKKKEVEQVTDVKQTKTGVNYYELSMSVNAMLNRNQNVYMKTKDDIQMGKVIYRLVADKGQNWVEQQLNRLISEIKESTSINEDNIEYLLTSQSIQAIQ